MNSLRAVLHIWTLITICWASPASADWLLIIDGWTKYRYELQTTCQTDAAGHRLTYPGTKADCVEAKK